MTAETPQPEALARELQSAPSLFSTAESGAYRISGDLRDRILSALRPAAVSNEQQADDATVERVARAILAVKDLSGDTLYQHHEWEDWPTDERTEYKDAFTGEPRIMLFHKAWRCREKEARAAIAALSLTPAQEEKPDGWRPIETAPFEYNKRFLICRVEGGVIRWVHDASRRDLNGPWGQWDGRKLTHSYIPTHWAEMIAFPQIESLIPAEPSSEGEG